MTGLHTVSAVGSCRRANLPNWRRRFGIDSTSLQTAPPHKSACALCVLSLDGVRWRVLLCFALRESHHDVRAHHVHTHTRKHTTTILRSHTPPALFQVTLRAHTPPDPCRNTTTWALVHIPASAPAAALLQAVSTLLSLCHPRARIAFLQPQTAALSQRSRTCLYATAACTHCRSHGHEDP